MAALRLARSAFYVVRETGKIRSACGQHGIQYIKWSMDKYKHNYVRNFTCVFFYISSAIKTD